MSSTPRCSSTWAWPASTSVASSRWGCPRATDREPLIHMAPSGRTHRDGPHRGATRPQRLHRPAAPRPAAARRPGRRALPREAASPRPSGAAALDGFYLRAGLILDGSQSARFKDEDCSSMSPGALYGCDNGNDGAPLSSLGDFGTNAGIDLGLGYVAARALRLEAALQHHPAHRLRGSRQLQPNHRQTGRGREAVRHDRHARRLCGPACAGSPPPGPFQSVRRRRRRPVADPYQRHPHGVPENEDHRSGRTVDGFGMDGHRGVGGVFGGKGDAGPGVALHGLRHRGKPERPRAGSSIRDGRPPFPLPLARTRADLRGHGFTASLRYAF